MFDMLVYQRVLHPRCVTFVTCCGGVIINLPLGGSPNTNCKCLVCQYMITSHPFGGANYQLKLAVEDYALPCPKTSVLTCMLSIIVMIMSYQFLACPSQRNGELYPRLTWKIIIQVCFRSFSFLFMVVFLYVPAVDLPVVLLVKCLFLLCLWALPPTQGPL